MNFPNASGVPSGIAAPCCTKRLRVSGTENTLVASRFTQATACGLMPAGPSMPNQAPTSASMPCSIRVGTSGSTATRCFAETASGRTLRVRGRGVPTKGRAGDLLVTVEVAVPQRLTPGAREAVEKLATELPDDPRPEVTAAVQARGAR